ncbi:ABC transporter permease [Christensenellaceae bacterium OttesenSCG-928-M15]|nr:ABC transporter permease [Christensenellaceae bacterium OttesenSCG-928-M15]
MGRYIGKRLLLMIPVIIGITFIVFTILEFTPGDPVKIMLGSQATEEAVDARREELGLNDPFLVRYFRFLGNAARGDLGRTYVGNHSVAESIFSRLPVTILLAMLSVAFAVMIGIPIGILSATKQYSLVDVLSMLFAMIASAIPAFWLGLMLIMLFSVRWDLFPSFGISQGLTSFILPSVTLSIAYSAQIIRLTRSTMLEVIRQDYIRTARAKGATQSQIIRRHALKNAMIPVVTVVGLYFGAMLGGAVIIESVFALPGVGTLLINSINGKDIPAVLGCVTILAIMFSLVNLLVDIVYASLDPRIKAQYRSAGKMKKARTGA